MRYAPHSLVALVLVLLAGGAWAQTVTDPDQVKTEKRAQTGMKFLSVTGSARGAALGNTLGALRNGTSTALFVNPASMGEMDVRVHASAARTQWISDIDYDFVSAAYRPGTGQYGVVGLSVVNVAYGSFFRTIRADNEEGFSDLGTYSPTALAVGLGYARAITDRFSIGGQAKFVRQSLGTHPVRYGANDGLEQEEFEKSVLAYDFGVLYRTGFESLTIGMHARNFAPEVTYVRNSFELPLSLDISASMNVFDLTALSPEVHRLEIHSSFTRPRDFYEQVRVGGEYLFMETVALRAGYAYPTDQEGIHLGGGLRTSIQELGMSFDYAYSDFGVFDPINRFSVGISF